MMKWLTIIMMVLVLPMVMADKGEIEIYKPREIIDLSVHLTNNTGDVTNANCSIQIRNESYGTLVDEYLGEVGNGWYNFTYRTNNTGKYFCRWNCTQGTQYIAETCDFVVGVDDNMALGMVVFIPLFIAGFFLVVSWMLDSKKYWALKFAMIMLGFVFIFQAYWMNNLVISEFFTSSNITNAIGDATWIYGMTFVAVFMIFLITFIYDVFMLFSSKKHKTGEYNEW